MHHHLQTTLIKKSNLDLIKSLDLLTTLQDTWEQRNMLRAYYKDTISKIQLQETAGQTTCFPQQINCNRKTVGGETSR